MKLSITLVLGLELYRCCRGQDLTSHFASMLWPGLHRSSEFWLAFPVVRRRFPCWSESGGGSNPDTDSSSVTAGGACLGVGLFELGFADRALLEPTDAL
jgi:hypothetical protein